MSPSSSPSPMPAVARRAFQVAPQRFIVSLACATPAASACLSAAFVRHEARIEEVVGGVPVSTETLVV